MAILIRRVNKQTDAVYCQNQGLPQQLPPPCLSWSSSEQRQRVLALSIERLEFRPVTSWLPAGGFDLIYGLEMVGICWNPSFLRLLDAELLDLPDPYSQALQCWLELLSLLLPSLEEESITSCLTCTTEEISQTSSQSAHPS